METRPIPNAPGYFAREDGVIIGPGYGGRRPRPLKPVKLKSGYWYVGIRARKNVFRLRLVNRLIAIAFHGEPPTPKHHAAHRDGNRDNNASGNISWLTAKENMADMTRHGTRCIGEQRSWARLTDAKVIDARRRYAEGRSIKSMAAELGVHRKTLRHALLGITWGHVGSTL